MTRTDAEAGSPSLQDGLLPLAVFALGYYFYDLLIATAALMAAVAVQTGIHWLRHRQVSRQMLLGTTAVLLLGGLTLWLRDPIFIMWKPTLVYWITGLALLGSGLIGRRNISERLLGRAVSLDGGSWRVLNTAWALQMLATGALNLYIAYNYSEVVWVNFKLFGLLGIQLVFFVITALFIAMRQRSETNN